MCSSGAICATAACRSGHSIRPRTDPSGNRARRAGIVAVADQKDAIARVMQEV